MRNGTHDRAGDEVAVVIPSRDRWPLLRTALACALAQEGVDVRVVVVDDGSTDATAAELAALDDPRVETLRHSYARGVSAARNLGLATVTAPWVAFLDDDDVWAPGHLAAMLAAARAAEAAGRRVGLVYSGHLVVDRDRRPTMISAAEHVDAARRGLDRFNTIGGPSRVLLATDAAREAGGFDERLSIIADWDLWVRIVSGREIVRSPELLVGYMRHAENMHLDADGLLAEVAFLQRKHAWPARRRRGRPVPQDTLAFHVAETYRASGRRLRAAGWFVRSARARGSVRDLGRAAGMLLGERAIELSGLKARIVMEPSLGLWLDAVRRTEQASTSGLPALPWARADRAPATP